MKKIIKSCHIKQLFLTYLFFIFLLFNYTCTIHAESINLNGNLSVTEQAVFSKSNISKDDLLTLKAIPLNYKNWSFRETNNKIFLTENCSSRGAILESSVDKTIENNNNFQLKVDTDNPIITVKSSLGDIMKQVSLTKKELQDRQIKIIITDDLMEKLDEMESMNGLTDSQRLPGNPLLRYYYPYQDNGHKYKAGVHVLCNDFNGPANTSHVYWSKKVHPVKALNNFIGSDCYYDQYNYKCEMNGNKKCKGLNKKPHNCSTIGGFSVKLHWRA